MILYVWLWLLTALVLCFIELGHPGLFFFLALSAGSLCAAGTALLDYSVFIQLVTMALSSLVVFLGITWWIMRSGYLRQQQGATRTNVFALQGQRALITKAIFPGSRGEIKVAGQIWPAQTNHVEGIIPEGTWVIIVRIQGCHCVVQPLDVK